MIGRRCRHVPRERAHEVIAGYLIVNDVSVRDWQLRTPTMTMGKSFDTHGPLGPWLATADEVGDPHALRLRTWVNGELRQDSNTKHLIFDCFGDRRAPLDGVHARAGRRDRDRHAGRRRRRDEAAAPARRSATSCASRSRASARSRTA